MCARSQKKIPPLLLSQRENKQGQSFGRLSPLPRTDFIAFLQVSESYTTTQLQQSDTSEENKSVELTLCLKRFSHCLAFNSVFVTWSNSESLNDCFTHYLNNNNKKYMYATLIYCYNSAIYRLMPQPVILF